MRTFNGQPDPHGWLADDAAKARAAALARSNAGRMSQWGSYETPLNFQGLGGSVANKTFADPRGPVQSSGGGLLAAKPVGYGGIVDQQPRFNSTTNNTLDPRAVAAKAARDAMMAGGGVRPGRAPPMNAVEFARSQGGNAYGIGGSNVGGNPDPRKAAINPYIMNGSTNGTPPGQPMSRPQGSMVDAYRKQPAQGPSAVLA